MHELVINMSFNLLLILQKKDHIDFNSPDLDSDPDPGCDTFTKRYDYNDLPDQDKLLIHQRINDIVDGLYNCVSSDKRESFRYLLGRHNKPIPTENHFTLTLTYDEHEHTITSIYNGLDAEYCDGWLVADPQDGIELSVGLMGFYIDNDLHIEYKRVFCNECHTPYFECDSCVRCAST